MVSTTSSKLEHAPFVTVHLSVTLAPAFNPVTVLTAEVLSVITAPFAAPMIVHRPDAVAGDAAVAANVKFGVLHSS